MTENDAKRSYMIAGTVMSARPLEPALYLVATPIGNLADITLRALETLAGADVLACEDTRVTRILLNRYAIRQKPLAYHEHNAEQTGPVLIEALKEGRSVALVSDAGTPLVSDPGFRLVAQAQAAGCRIVPIPGPSAVLAALTASGLPCDSFLFAGFLPVKDGQRRARLEALKAVPATLVFFESPRRLAATLAAMSDVLGAARDAAVGRELTKTFEEMHCASLAKLTVSYSADKPPKGEIVICVGPPQARQEVPPEDMDQLLLALSNEMPASKAASEAARMTGGKKGDLYRRLLNIRGKANG